MIGKSSTLARCLANRPVSSRRDVLCESSVDAVLVDGFPPLHAVLRGFVCLLLPLLLPLFSQLTATEFAVPGANETDDETIAGKASNATATSASCSRV